MVSVDIMEGEDWLIDCGFGWWHERGWQAYSNGREKD